jgi:hypothetical protein
MRVARFVALGLLSVGAVCTDPQPTTGALIVEIDGLPAGSAGQVTVYGPNAFKQVLTGTTTLEKLAPGSYVVSPGIVKFASALYTSSPSLTRTITAGQTENATITYALGSGSINLSVTGLPAGITPSIIITGPIARTVNAPGIIGELLAGTYTLTMDTLASAQGDLWGAAQRQQLVTITPSLTPVDVAVHYDIASGTLQLTVDGLPADPGTPITITGPNGYLRRLGGSVRYPGIAPGTYTATAVQFTSCPEMYTPSVAQQTLTVVVGETASSSVSYAKTVASDAELNLSIGAMYFVQAVQDLAGSVPLVAGHPALLRVFGRANQCNAATPEVRVTLSTGDVYDVRLDAAESAAATDINEAYLTRSWNVLIPGSKVQPGLTAVAEIDPDNAIAEADEGDNRFPPSGAQAPNVRVMPTIGLRFVPVTIGGATGQVSSTRIDSLLSLAYKIHPVSGYDVDIRAVPYTSSRPPLTRDDANSWAGVLSEINVLRTADSSRRYYHGIVHVGYTSGVAGIAYIGGRAGVSWDNLPSAAEVVAHELGHNFGRLHSPCGNPGGVDQSYPYSDGRTGAYGYDIVNGSLRVPAATDIMGYCNNKWISAYTFTGMLFALEGQQASLPVVSSTEVEPALLVWGRVDDGVLTLEPAFEVRTRAALPSASGAYRVAALDEAGAEITALSFDAERIADLPGDHRTFAFAMPMRLLRGRTPAALRLSGGGRAVTHTRSAAVSDVPSATVARVNPRAARVQWDASKFPAVLIRDADTGDILSIARGGDATISTNGQALELQYSDRVRSVGRQRAPLR